MVMRFDPYRELDRLTEQFRGVRAPQVPIDAFRRGDTFFVLFDLPGVDASSIDLEVEKNVLTVKAERRAVAGEADEIIVAERAEGAFSRQLFLGEGLDAENVEANYDKGVLTVTIPLAERAKARKVTIGGGTSGAQPIDTGSTSD